MLLKFDCGGIKALLTGCAFFVQIIHLKIIFFKLLIGILYIYIHVNITLQSSQQHQQQQQMCSSPVSQHEALFDKMRCKTVDLKTMYSKASPISQASHVFLVEALSSVKVS